MCPDGDYIFSVAGAVMRLDTASLRAVTSLRISLKPISVKQQSSVSIKRTDRQANSCTWYLVYEFHASWLVRLCQPGRAGEVFTVVPHVRLAGAWPDKGGRQAGSR